MSAVKNGVKGNGTADYVRYGFYASVVSALAAAFIWVGSIANQVSTIAGKQGAIEERLGRMEENLTRNGLSIASLDRNQHEIETQFCADDDTRNLMQASDLRVMALLWQKSYDTAFPLGTAYYPRICQRGEVK